MKNCSRCSQVTGAIRIIVGAALLFFGITKLGADPATQEMLGSAAHKFGLTFLSTTVWFWLAVAWEIIAGLSLLFGYKSKSGAILAIIIMIFAWNFTGRNMNVNAILVLIGSLIVLWKGSGSWAVQPCGSCGTGWSCSTKSTSCCGWGSCGMKDGGEEIVEVE